MHMIMLRIVITFVCGFMATAAVAQVPLSGSLVASRDCPALQSIRKGTNPGGITLSAGQSYRLIGKNKETATHYWIEVPGAQPLQRWVEVNCGRVGDKAAATSKSSQKQTKKSGNAYVLAISWQPAFCEGLPNKVECRQQTAQSFEATHFTLHGLWPQPRRNVFCGVDKATAALSNNRQWDALPEVRLTPETRKALQQVMPGTQSFLDRHEWIKHGTCYPAGDAEPYFRDAIRIMDAVNSSPIQAFAAQNIGQTIRSSDLRGKFDEAFGPGAGDRVRVACKPDGGRQLIVEITIGLVGDISSGVPVKDLIAASEATDPGCPSGVIDAVGLQ
jgi:ribonuclease T2